jgi:hypothetical protein
MTRARRTALARRHSALARLQITIRSLRIKAVGRRVRVFWWGTPCRMQPLQHGLPPFEDWRLSADKPVAWHRRW